MKIAVLSGKGGTGKTFVSVNIAAVASQALYVDCDIEEPNGHLFFKPQGVLSEEVTVKIPFVDDEACNGCRVCVDFCKFNALALINEKLLIFEDICHSCGGCTLLCPEKALVEKDKPIGLIEKGSSDNVTVMTGILNLGEPSGVPIIEKLTDELLLKDGLTVIDCPPGTACIAMESIKAADYCILVAEPSVFGIHNLNMVYELVQLFDKPLGVVINKSLAEDNLVEEFCVQHNITILSKIPFSTELGTLNSNALIASKNNPQYKDLFINLLNAISKEVHHETTLNS